MLTFGLTCSCELYIASRHMKIVKSCAIVMLLLALLAVLPICGAAAESGASIAANTAIFVANYGHVTAYPATGRGNLPPIALDTEMLTPRALARDASGRLYVTNSAINTVTVYAA